MKIDLDEDLCCKDVNGVEWTLVPLNMRKDSENILRKYKTSNTVGANAAYRYLVTDKPNFKYNNNVERKVDNPINYFLWFVIGIILLALFIHLGVRYYTDIKNIVVIREYAISSPSLWLMVSAITGSISFCIIYKSFKRRK